MRCYLSLKILIFSHQIVSLLLHLLGLGLLFRSLLLKLNDLGLVLLNTLFLFRLGLFHFVPLLKEDLFIFFIDVFTELVLLFDDFVLYLVDVISDVFFYLLLSDFVSLLTF